MFANYISPLMVLNMHPGLSLRDFPFTYYTLGTLLHLLIASCSFSISKHIYLLLYVDDIIITGNNSMHISSLINALSTVFELKDHGAFNYFLGVQITRSEFRLTLTLSKYASDVLH